MQDIKQGIIVINKNDIIRDLNLTSMHNFFIIFLHIYVENR